MGCKPINFEKQLQIDAFSFLFCRFHLVLFSSIPLVVFGITFWVLSKGSVCWVYPFLVNFLSPASVFDWARAFHKYWCGEVWAVKRHTLFCIMLKKSVWFRRWARWFISDSYFLLHFSYVLCPLRIFFVPYSTFLVLLAFSLRLCITINLNYIDSLSLRYILSHLIIFFSVSDLFRSVNISVFILYISNPITRNYLVRVHSNGRLVQCNETREATNSKTKRMREETISYGQTKRSQIK